MSNTVHPLMSVRPVGASSAASGDDSSKQTGRAHHTARRPSFDFDFEEYVVTKFTNCKVIEPASRFWEAQQEHVYAADIIVDCKGNIVAPGFIDVQLNGAFGVDFTTHDNIRQDDDKDEYEDGITSVARGLLYQGVTSFLPTVITSSPHTYRTLLPILSAYTRQQNTRRHDMWKANHRIHTCTHATNTHNTTNNNVASAVSYSPSPSPAPLDSTCAACAFHGRQKSVRPAVLHMKDCCSHYTSSAQPSSTESSSSSSSSSTTSYTIVDGDRSLVAQVLGTHLEGPFISVYGAHPPHLTLAPSSPSSLTDVYGCLDDVRMVTLAPELEGSIDAIASLHAQSIVVSAGHSQASLAEAERGVAAGITCVTHLFNAMKSFHHRDPGIIGLLASSSPSSHALHFGVICDGYHCHPASLRIAYHTRPSSIVLVSDAMCAMGLKDGVYTFGTLTVKCENGTAKIAGTKTLAGSVARMDECVRNFKSFTSCNAAGAIEAASTNAARSINLTSKGRLVDGCDGDIVILDDELRVHGVWIHGKRAWHHKECASIIYTGNIERKRKINAQKKIQL